MSALNQINNAINNYSDTQTSGTNDRSPEVEAIADQYGNDHRGCAIALIEHYMPSMNAETLVRANKTINCLEKGDSFDD